MVLGIVLLAVGLGLTIATLVGTLSGGESMLTFVPRLMGNLLSAALSAVGSVTLVFWLVQRYMPEVSEEFSEEEGFDPLKLEPVPPSPDRVSVAELIAENVFLFIAWTVLTFFPDWIAVISVRASGTYRIPLFHAEALRPYLIAFTFIWLFEFFLNLYLIRKGRKTVGTRALDILLSLSGLGIFLWASQDPGLINREALAFFPGPLGNLAGVGGRLFILLIVFLTLLEVGKQMIPLLKRK
jgi:flagellar biosynthesis protein FliQ